MDRDAAAIALVDSNLHREHILPSEKAFAYKLKMDALKQQGLRTDLTSSQVATKLDSATEIGKKQGDSRDTVFRYIRLTYLIPEILQMVDDRKIALTPAVDISYLTKKEQADLLETMECEDCTPSVSQAIRMKQLSQAGELDVYTIFDILYIILNLNHFLKNLINLENIIIIKECLLKKHFIMKKNIKKKS